MSQLKLHGMKAAYDEILAAAVKRQHDPQRMIGELLQAEISEKQARSIKYQMTVTKLPLAKEIEEFRFEVSRDTADESAYLLVRTRSLAHVA